jgi:hypothetical protein
MCSNLLFSEQAKGYVKALEKSTAPVFILRKVFEHGAESFSAKGKEEEILFEGPSCSTLALNWERWSGRVIKTAVAPGRIVMLESVGGAPRRSCWYYPDAHLEAEPRTRPILCEIGWFTTNNTLSNISEGQYTHEQYASDRLRGRWVAVARAERHQDLGPPLALAHVRNLDSLGDFLYSSKTIAVSRCPNRSDEDHSQSSPRSLAGSRTQETRAHG